MLTICSRSIAGRAAGIAAIPQRPQVQQRQHSRSVLAHDSKDGKSKSVDDVLREANALLENLSAGMPSGTPALQASIDELEQMGYVCDESGCVLVLPGDRERAAGPPAINGLLSGDNWSLGMLPEPDSDDDEEGSPYTALVSGPCWSVPLKPSELSDFVGMLSQLRLMVANLAAQGQWHGGSADRPASRVKWETNHIVMKAAHAPTEPGFSIEITFRTDRRSVSAAWPAEVAAAVIAAVDTATGGSAGSRAAQEPAAAAAAAVEGDGVQVQLIGADGITQVAAAQALGLSGRGVHLCIIDGPIDIRHPTFGFCRSPGQPGPPACRVYTAYNADTQGEDVEPPLPLGTWDMHGTHTAGIAAGSFPFKLKDKDGQPLSHQRGVAYGALLGAFSFGRMGKTAECMAMAAQRSCNILDREINTKAGLQNILGAEAFLRVDTPATTYNPLTDALNLPQQLVLLCLRAPEDICSPLEAITKGPNLKGKVFVLEISQECINTLYEEFGAGATLWETYKALKPKLTLFALPSDAAAFECAARLTHKGMPMLWLRADDGAALADALAADPEKVLKLVGLPGATASQMPADLAGQPMDYSSMGPTLDFAVKPDLAAPGTLYSSAPDHTYAPLTGTSMACPYVSGVVALWREAMTKAGITEPPGGWVAAAAAALKNTAKPLPFPNTSSSSSSLMYPPAKIGAGLVQAHAAVTTPVSINPLELPLRTDLRSQTLQLNLTNTGSVAVSYTVGHQPAVGVSLTRAWFMKAYNPALPTAVVSPVGAVVTVPAKGSIGFEVTISAPPALRQLDDVIFSGFVTFTPINSINNSSSSSSSSSRRGAAAVPLSVPYQGASRDYSRIGSNSSLALFARPLPALDPVASTLLQNRPLMYVCDAANYDSCDFKPGVAVVVKGYSIRVAATFVRPVAQVRLQLYDARNNTHLGTQDFGACRAAAPNEITSLSNCDRFAQLDPLWFGEYNRPDGSRVDFIKAGMYKLKALIYAPLAVAEAAAGRRAQRRPYVVTVANLLRIAEEE
ncbi:hypothetical protein OEZ85_013356 [Tetradesmus obliquus]|uniref:Peptidase S8/S53 domain-containing protein n=1 Tax=Tetradesmus obliquus TaxID=3088 RepID=A0ABY8U6G4_TETOB|nr:hypothetical protein OEZ85_013356 [Tetradesmus obliquus]